MNKETQQRSASLILVSDLEGRAEKKKEKVAVKEGGNSWGDGGIGQAGRHAEKDKAWRLSETGEGETRGKGGADQSASERGMGKVWEK